MSRIVSVAMVLAVCVLDPRGTRAQVALGDGIKEMATQIIASVTEGNKRRVAVVAFRELDGQPTVLGAYLAESLTTHLFGAKGLQIVERTMLDRVMTEMKLGATGAINPSTAAQIGKLAGVDAIVTGSITDMQSSVAVNCRLIDVSTGSVFGAVETRIIKDDDMRAIMGKPMGPTSPEGPDSGGQKPQARSAPTTVQGFQFDLESCTRKGGAVTCTFWVTNQRSDRSFFIGSGVGVVGFKAWDDRGNQYSGQQIQVANRTMDPLGVKLLANIRTKLIFYIEGNVIGDSLSRLQFSASGSDVGFFQVVISDLPLTNR
jgi:TolB-like protein